MKKFLAISFVLITIASFLVFYHPQQANAVPVSYNQTAINIPWTTVPRNSSVTDVFVEDGYNGTVTNWYHGSNGSAVLLKKFGGGPSTLTVSCPLKLSVSSIGGFDGLVSNSSKIYYMCNVNSGGSLHLHLHHIDTITATNANDFSSSFPAGPVAVIRGYISMGDTSPVLWVNEPSNAPYVWRTIIGNNNTYGVATTIGFHNSAKIQINGAVCLSRFNTNGTSICDTAVTSTNQCELTYMPNNSTLTLDSSACDLSFSPHTTRYFNGLQIYNIGNFYTNSTQSLLSSIESSPYKHHLTLLGVISGKNDPYTAFVLHANAINYMVIVTSTNYYYAKMSDITTLLGQNHAVQDYTVALVTTDSGYNFPKTSIQQSGIVTGVVSNQTFNRWGMYSLISGFTAKGTTLQSAIRYIDPVWTNNNNDYPTIFTTTSLFPIILTVADAPVDAALMATNPACVINSQECVWSITRLDSTHTAEFDIPSNQCANIYVADSSVAPTIFLFQGNTCATGTNTKSIAYTNTLATTFYTMNYGATSSYTPSTNGLSTTVRGAIFPFTYNVIIKNSTGAITQNFTKLVSGNIDTHVFNVTNATKPASLYVSISGVGQIYTSYLGSSLTLASASSFFHQYFSYQGFDLLSFIPIIFASMFTRNTVGIGAALTVVCIATLSWLSIVVIPDTAVYTMIFVAVLGMVGYRSLWG